MNFRTLLQLDEALGDVNRYFCSRFHNRDVRDARTLVEYFIRSGGAEDFARRYDEAMGVHNRWYCSEYYRCDVGEPSALWDYYINHAPLRAHCRDMRLPREQFRAG